MPFLWRKKKPNRSIFRYFDGTRERGIDPMVAFRRLISHPTFDIEKHLAEIDGAGGVKTQAEATGIAVNATRDVFELQPYDEATDTGLTEQETLNLLNSYIAWCEAVKKNGSGQPI